MSHCPLSPDELFMHDCIYAQQDCCIRLEQQHLALTTAHAMAIEGERLANATTLSQAFESQRQSSAALDEIMAELASLRCVQETGLPAVLMAEFTKLKVSGYKRLSKR